MVTDRISDFIVRLRNAGLAGKEFVVIPYSRILDTVATVLEREGFVGNVVKRGKKLSRSLEVLVLYGDKQRPRINGIKRVSKPGRRVYLGVKDIHSPMQGYGRLIVSTPKGVISDREARRQRVGGEVLIEVW